MFARFDCFNKFFGECFLSAAVKIQNTEKKNLMLWILYDDDNRNFLTWKNYSQSGWTARMDYHSIYIVHVSICECSSRSGIDSTNWVIFHDKPPIQTLYSNERERCLPFLFQSISPLRYAHIKGTKWFQKCSIWVREMKGALCSHSYLYSFHFAILKYERWKKITYYFANKECNGNGAKRTSCPCPYLFRSPYCVFDICTRRNVIQHSYYDYYCQKSELMNKFISF